MSVDRWMSDSFRLWTGRAMAERRIGAQYWCQQPEGPHEPPLNMRPEGRIATGATQPRSIQGAGTIDEAVVAPP